MNAVSITEVSSNTKRAKSQPGSGCLSPGRFEKFIAQHGQGARSVEAPQIAEK